MADLEKLLLKTSRTFALTIPLLREPMRRQVTIAYLLFRIVDTFEDASHWPQQLRIEALSAFVDLLAAGQSPDQETARREVIRWLAQSPSTHAGYVELIEQVPEVLATFSSLAPPARAAIRSHTIRTAHGMMSFVSRTTEDGRLQLDDLADLRHYCYIVAGIVGEMLTELFLLERDELTSSAPALRERAALFGEALQLVNILKDSAGDAREGRYYLPPSVDRAEVFRLARADLDSSIEYVSALQSAAAERGLVAFAALPVLLAKATLDRVEEVGPGAKLTRPEVAAIVSEMNLALDESRPAVPL